MCLCVNKQSASVVIDDTSGCKTVQFNIRTGSGLKNACINSMFAIAANI